MKHDLISVGGATEDIAFNTAEGVVIDNKKDVLRQKLLCFEFGAKIKVDKTISTFGGGAANVAVGASRLGLKAAAIVSVGNDDRGRRIKENFKSQGVDAGFMQIAKKKETAFSFILRGPENEHVVFSNRAASDELKITVREIGALKKTRWIYVTSLSGKWNGVIKKIFKLKRQKIAWNPGHRQLLEGYKSLGGYIKKVEVLLVNKDEAIELVRSHPDYLEKQNDFLNNIGNLLEIISSWGPRYIVITDGRNGAYVRSGGRNYFQGILKEKKCINTAGVGDAFGSSFVTGLILFNDIKKAMYLGVQNTASVVAHYGAQAGLITRKQIKN